MSEIQFLPVKLTDVNDNCVYINGMQVINAYTVSSREEAKDHPLKEESYPCTYVRMTDGCYVFTKETPEQVYEIIMAAPAQMLQALQGAIAGMVNSF